MMQRYLDTADVYSCAAGRGLKFAVAQRLLEERAAVAPASRVKTILRRGEVAYVLAALACDEHVDLVVVGTPAHHRAGDIFVGSVAERLIRLARARWPWRSRLGSPPTRRADLRNSCTGKPDEALSD